MESEKINPEVKEKKKRGRKPKPKPLEPVIKEKKKRGRKPKIKLMSDDEIKKFVLPSKRGRKPKDKMNNFNKDLNLDNISSCILHLPIPLSKIENIDNNLIVNEINPYDPLLINNMNNDNVDDNKCIYSKIENVDFIDSNDTNNNSLVDNNVNNNISNNYIKTDSGTHTSNIKCNWCLHSCDDNNLIKLPYRLKMDKIEYYGNFCCPECACAFNFNELNDEYIWERYSLLNYLYGDDNNKINIAPSRLVLDIFGGPLSINEYRNLNTNKQYLNVIMPPQYVICPQLEVSQLSSNNSRFIPLNMNRINKYTNQLKEKTNIVINNTLENCMNLKCI